MRKKLLLISLCCIAFIQLNALEKSDKTLQDSIKFFKRNKLDLSKSLKDLRNLDVDTSELYALNENFDLGDISDLTENTFNVYSHSGSDFNVFGTNQTTKEPTRVENRTFSNISEIEFFHQYGNIVVRESGSKQVELEIQYFDKKNNRPSCDITTTNRLLSISTSGGSSEKINYIIGIPRNTDLSINLKYGNIRMDRFSGAFSANLSYSNLDVQSFIGTKPIIKDRYGKINIGSVRDIDLSASYSKVKIDKANNIELSCKYSDCVFDDVESIISGSSSASGNFKIGKINTMNVDMKYVDLSIDNLVSNLNTTCAYTNISINSISSRTNIKIGGQYSDISLSIPPEVSAYFSTSLSYGSLGISKKYSVKYTEQKESSFREVKKGQIGTRNPTATIDISNTYADVRIR